MKMKKPKTKTKLAYNPYNSHTGPYNQIGGWGLPAGKKDKCPKCESKTFHCEFGFAEAATNKCNKCDYSEFFAY